jgi:hypothetical protein
MQIDQHSGLAQPQEPAETSSLALLRSEDSEAIFGAALVTFITGVQKPASKDDVAAIREWRRAYKLVYRLVDHGLPVHRRHGNREYEGTRLEIAAWYRTWRQRVEMAGPAGLTADPLPRRRYRSREERPQV